jgi:hypothetical protein
MNRPYIRKPQPYKIIKTIVINPVRIEEGETSKGKPKLSITDATKNGATQTFYYTVHDETLFNEFQLNRPISVAVEDHDWNGKKYWTITDIDQDSGVNEPDVDNDGSAVNEPPMAVSGQPQAPRSLNDEIKENMATKSQDIKENRAVNNAYQLISAAIQNGSLKIEDVTDKLVEDLTTQAYHAKVNFNE